MIQRDDLEGKFKELQTAVEETTTGAKKAGAVGAIGLILLLVVIYLLGRRRGQKGGAVLEVYKL
jgi:LPXTG-motif cell wall-anchored protein